MATKQASAGIDHPTAVPANFEPDAAGEDDADDGPVDDGSPAE